jgi:16S rRNA (guanine(966)-N(2))-methyltransferase RsmD
MRVIAGVSRGRRLSELKGHDVRPTPDRVREALFSILLSKLGSLNDLVILDLFAGSGALAIEALSRGAAHACLVEKNPDALKAARDNLERCSFTNQSEVIAGDAFSILPNLKKPFDLIFLDPPYNKGLAVRAATEIESSGLLSNEGILCVETGVDENLPKIIGNFIRLDQRRYGSVMIQFYSISDEGMS